MSELHPLYPSNIFPQVSPDNSGKPRSSFHGELWWFPEYDANLGLAKGKAQSRSDGTWIREFQNGIVLVNPTNRASTISFATVYQNASTGNKDTRFTVQPQDGGIFLLAH